MIRVALCLFLCCFPALGWRCDGHQILALIAEGHLNPRARAAVTDLLKNQPFDRSNRKYCLDGPDDPMADASTWADDVKAQEKNGYWHYIDIPRGVEHGEIDAYCEPVAPVSDAKYRGGCLSSALKYEYGILRDASATDAERAKALRYMIHFMGDLHQPLHTTDNNDHGGNCVPIQFFGEPKSNLHDVWDYQVLDRDMEKKHRSVTQFAADLDARYAREWPLWGEAPVDFDRWIREEHRIADEVAYGKLHPTIPIEKPDPHTDCRVETHKLEALHLRVGEPYQQAAAAVVERGLAQGGYRLADVLNQVWP